MSWLSALYPYFQSQNWARKQKSYAVPLITKTEYGWFFNNVEIVQTLHMLYIGKQPAALFKTSLFDITLHALPRYPCLQFGVYYHCINTTFTSTSDCGDSLLVSRLMASATCSARFCRKTFSSSLSSVESRKSVPVLQPKWVKLRSNSQPELRKLLYKNV